MSKQIQATLWAGLLITLLSACASEPERPDPPTGYLATHIEEDGTKKFQYTIDVPDPRERRGNGRVVQPDMVYIRGECEEKATDDDIERYASNQG